MGIIFGPPICTYICQMQDDSHPFIIQMEATTGNTSEPVAEGWYRMVMYSDSSPVSTIHEFELINLTNILDLEFL